MTQIVPWAKQQPFEDDYDLQDLMGRGRFGTVNKCQHKKTGEFYAAKIVDKRATRKGFTKEKAKLEVDILKMINHPNCMHLVDVYESRQKMVLVLELIAGGELFHKIAAKEIFTELEAIPIIRSILDGLVYLHSLNIVHRDLKPENILLKGNDLDSGIKLIDFGLSVILGPQPIKELVGTLEYSAPEVINFEPTTCAADLWSVGVITYLLLSGGLPFKGDTEAETHSQINKAVLGFDQDFETKPSPEAIDFISKLLQKMPKKRPTAKDCLDHDWFKLPMKIAQRATAAPTEHVEPAHVDKLAIANIISQVHVNKIKQFNAQERWRRVLSIIRQAQRTNAKASKNTTLSSSSSTKEDTLTKASRLRAMLESIQNPGDSDTEFGSDEDLPGSRRSSRAGTPIGSPTTANKRRARAITSPANMSPPSSPTPPLSPLAHGPASPLSRESHYKYTHPVPILQEVPMAKRPSVGSRDGIRPVSLASAPSPNNKTPLASHLTPLGQGQQQPSSSSSSLHVHSHPFPPRVDVTTAPATSTVSTLGAPASCKKETEKEKEKEKHVHMKQETVTLEGISAGAGVSSPSALIAPAPTRRRSSKALASVVEYVNPIVRGEAVMGVQAVNSVVVADGVNGQVYVKNMAYEKTVTVHWTENDGVTTHCTNAWWSHAASPVVDVFRFVLPVPPGHIATYSVKYECAGHTYWDNNKGANYSAAAVACVRRPSSTA
eukprot:comp23163_c0_seq1/m.37470 comp23163_c0_seq1/g.37470  ORF comp23163_c0_seq1/g.37470 comp23163_c0_seq1/m.37470 type:complete len:719 (-) comp23163_c0_seq1:300-2456(-)